MITAIQLAIGLLSIYIFTGINFLYTCIHLYLGAEN